MNPRMPWIEHLMQDEGLTYEQAIEMLEGWEVVPFISEDGTHMASLIKRGAEVHFAAFKQFRHQGQITRKRLKTFLQPILDEMGFLTTKLAFDEPDGFIRRLGFVEIGRSPSHRIFMMTDIVPLGETQ